MTTTPFTIAIEEKILIDLQERLARTRWPDQVENASWLDGTDLSYLKELVEYWQHHFDWRF